MEKNPDLEQQKDYLFPREVMKRLRISHAKLKRMISDGEIVAVDVGGNWRIPVAEFEAYLERKRNVPATAPIEKVAA